ncbi:MAG: hypothetical protein NWQ38_15840 [Cellulophaga sp.]|nr:hypothetical protein [Cellulophaga sp.]
MTLFLRLFPLRILLLLSAVLLLILNVFSFYGLFVDEFSFSKFDNYIFPFLTIIHFIYLYTLWKKNKNSETPDVFLRNIEYALYFIYMIYIFKFAEYVFRFWKFTDFKNEIVPENFIPIGTFLITMHCLLLIITPLTFIVRKRIIGKYNFDELHDTMDSWK